MNISLEKIDELRERTQLSYKEAKEVLEKFDGDVVEALIYLEDENKTGKINKTVDSVIDTVKELIRAGNVNKIILKKDDEVMMNIPVTIGAIGAYLAPTLTILSFTGALVTKCSLEVIKEDGQVINITNFADETFDKVKRVAEDTFEKVKGKTESAIGRMKTSNEDKEESDFSKEMNNDSETKKDEDLQEYFEEDDEDGEDED